LHRGTSSLRELLTPEIGIGPEGSLPSGLPTSQILQPGIQLQNGDTPVPSNTGHSTFKFGDRNLSQSLPFSQNLIWEKRLSVG